MNAPADGAPFPFSEWDGRLARLALTKSTEFDEVAEEILTTAPGRAYVAERLRDAELGETAWQLARWDVERLCRAQDASWIEAACTWLDQGLASWSQSAEFCSDAAWTARSVRNSALLQLSENDVSRRDLDTPGGRGRLHLLLQSQRYDFRFDSIRRTVGKLGVPAEMLDPYSRAIHAFALLAEESEDALEEFETVRQLAPDQGKVGHALLHGLWFADYLPDQGERILALIASNKSLAETDPIVCFRKASALRKLRRYDEALEIVDRGMIYLDPRAVDVHADFVRERSMVLIVKELESVYRQEREALSQQAERHSAEVDRQVANQLDKIEGKISESLFKVVEILGLFTAVIALLASGAASVTIGSLQWWQRAVLILTAGAVVMTFFVAMRLIVRPRKGR